MSLTKIDESSFTGKKPPEEIMDIAKLRELNDLIPKILKIIKIDIVIPEIPYIACKHNTEKKKIIERIPITSAMDELLIYEDIGFNIEDQNYFFPISLHKLTIQLYQKNGKFFDNNNKHHSLEFEITMINKLDLVK